MSAMPFKLCGCLYAETEEEAIALQKIVRALGAGGFPVVHETKNEQGDTVTRTVSE